MILKTSNPEEIKPFLQKLYIAPPDSHKGMNGKVLIIGGSTLFHSASLWPAEIASYFVDMVHYSSTEENNEIFSKLKSIFRNGIIVQKKDIEWYIKEDDAVLIGPGMVRSEVKSGELKVKSFQELLNISDEAELSRNLTYYLLHTYPEKKFVIDAGALQMMDPEWLLNLKEKPIITPHQGEFERLFGEKMIDLPVEEKIQKVRVYAKKYNCIILLKAVIDIISDGNEVYVVEGGNAGLTKGGSGDILAGFTVSLFSKNDPITSALVASYIEKKTSDELSKIQGNWYNMTTLIKHIPEVLYKLL